MKKSLLLVLIALFCAASGFSLEATVTAVTGKAEYSSGADWKSLTPGTKLSFGTIIQTGCRSEVILTAGSTTLNVAALSRISIEKLAEQNEGDKTVSENSSFKLESGSVRSKTRRTDTRKVGHTVTGAVATASVRGTEYSIRNTYRGTFIKTHEGRVAIWNNKYLKKAKASKTGEKEEGPSSETGIEAGDIAGQAPSGSGTITKGQSASFGFDGSKKDAQNMANDRKKRSSSEAYVEQPAGAEGSGTAAASMSVEIVW